MKTFFSAHCLRNQGACCDLCIRACPRQALAWRPGSGPSSSNDPIGPIGPIGLARDAARCRACGLCACVCPAGVFAPHVDNRQIVRCLDNLPPEKQLVLFCPACGPSILPDKLALGAANALRLKACPSALHVSVLAALAVFGISDVDCVCGDCAGCGRGDKGKGLLLLRQAWQSLFSGRFFITRSVAGAGTEPEAKNGGRNCVCVETHKVPLQRRRFLRALFAPEKTRPGLEALVALEGAQWADARHPVLREIFQDILHVLLSGQAGQTSSPEDQSLAVTGGLSGTDALCRPDNSNGPEQAGRPGKMEAPVKAGGLSGRRGADNLKKIAGPVLLRDSAVLPELIRSAAFTIDADSCTACGACFRACPSGALAGALPGDLIGEVAGALPDELSGTWEKNSQPVEQFRAASFSRAKPGQTQQIMFLQRQCLDCGLCLAVCHSKALRRVEASRDLKTWLYGEAQCLARHELKECVRCRGVFHSASDDAQLCRFCAKRGGMPV